ncbi:diguanylate cyclase domain-containing protein [Catenovulum sediminis]|uniref:diguanylate cyclase n=1 Tax=Catenovulum sediminis TaxID=1740262 RepID=A0ABV1RHR4_9ALTE
MDNNTVLVVEDNPSTAKVIMAIAQKLGFEAEAVHSYAELITLSSLKAYFCVCADYHLPDAPNGEAIDLALSQQIPTFVLTGKLDEQTRLRVLKKSVVDFILKETIHSFDYVAKLLMRLRNNMNVRILVVDDSVSVRRYLTTLLERQNFIVAEAENGQQALEVLNIHNDIKLVVTDQEMPLMTGLQLTTAIRKEYSHEQLAVIAISNATDAMLTARFLKNGANDCLNKPFDAEEFYTRIFRNLEYIEQVEQIEFAAHHDYLTRVKNRRSFFEHAENILSTQSSGVALALLDLDHFKAINDTYGHDAGDIILVQATQRMQSHFPDAIVARLGGEEFCLLLPQVSPDEALGRLEFLCHHFESFAFNVANQQLQVTVSIGLVEADATGISAALKRADIALYQAKNNGRNQVVEGSLGQVN